ncbi:two-component system response regulator AgrA [Clostridium acetobutylicum]|uniref:Stage 0 sporulation protein A homolog n=1 Tax=Clostridium acetobutylicum (strain ATCC 824 / DSM 792 / JCM 1419 / IAM 19013 / LMG 5710 / NBRC 13948 / NRRL B-527 / VKM B-1787 / 2291 / W) TaxID=272562 RepID=Q97MW0_CLOAB|nr:MULTISPECIES: LytTR family DNA-binding domain-containing protein [Clostridium]AAK78066.1 Accessory gene regulator protein A [Clostridium acetobutylicum ATCC 824]ADZ19125.1 Accessory gene regulator protein A [Clostridium acetobutylicum EA 2018]AEI33089.1 accessory regulator protein A [Clostridium acetobutylicum DSM 1731]AWV81870.1 DNA-binding response regulator [Clostridium acetobutylicum]MBC2395419.1 response regulator transcription factor [Clostridium acetobutylicum]
MLEVFVCEDNKEQKENFRKIIDNFIIMENLDMKISVVTENPDDIINYVIKNSVSGLYFLDIDLNASINGIQLAAEIRKYDPRGFIVFVTTHAEMSYLTFLYKVEAMDYIIKDNYKNIGDRIYQCIVDAQRKYSAKTTDLQKIFTIKADDRIINIEFQKILFFETSFTIHKVVLHSVNRQIEFYAKMKDIEGELDDSFYRCHKSYIVNKKNIKEININKRRIYMINGEECLISTRMLKGLIK